MDLDNVTQLAESCLLPTLTVNIGDQQITREHFRDFQPILKGNLYKLLDTFHANETVLLEIDVNTVRFRKTFLMVICEQVAPNTVFQTQDNNLKNALKLLSNRLLPELCQSDTQLKQEIFEYFKVKLNKDAWKRNLGAIHGFVQYCHAVYGHEKNPLKLDPNEIQFLLSRALVFSDHFDPEFKVLALELFSILINPTYWDVIRQMNIDQVIYKEAFNMIEKAKESHYIQLLWSCLFTLINYEENYKTNRKDFRNWSRLDDVFEKLLCRIGFEDDKKLIPIYMEVLIKFMLIGRDEGIEGDAAAVVKELRSIKRPNYRVFRWVKRLFILFQNEGFKLGGKAESVMEYLSRLHIAFLLSIGTIPVVLTKRQLPEFLHKFITTLMEVKHLYKENELVKKEITNFLESIQLYLHRDFESYDTDDLEKIITELEEESNEGSIEETNFISLRNAVDDLLQQLIKS